MDIAVLYHADIQSTLKPKLHLVQILPVHLR